MTGREPTSDCSKKHKTQHCRKAVGTSVCFDKQATASPPSLHPCCRLHGHKSHVVPCCRQHAKNLKSHSYSSSIAEVISTATLCSCICGTRTARIRCTGSTCDVQKGREPVASDPHRPTEQHCEGSHAIETHFDTPEDCIFENQKASSSHRSLMVSWLVACSSALLFWLSSHSNSSRPSHKTAESALV